ncbi:binding-protein-dependent transport systems inner membrane component [Isosphaera pallida ATCC 43644]|uniref:Binding-protein-dependent transport systems inner membrane component n=1 Tax=Isosphaera pallida (strain ATCC 43644 / DSM 9630 / IS1B) TaxID=575540 RepID=E8R0P6_ISOPI|nr:binding-protein-dependent transport systems inner membrane component [Isosphaera pallida ATCC 43644]
MSMTATKRPVRQSGVVEAVPIVGRTWWNGRVTHLVRTVWPSLTVLILVVLAWDRAVVWGEIPSYLVPRPEAVARAAWNDRTSLASAAGLTAQAALCGFALSLVVGSLTALAFATWSWVRRSCYPYAIFLQTVPIVAIAPLINLYPGPGFGSVVLLSWMISLFPIVTGGTTGLTRVPPEWLELFRLYGAGRWTILWKLRIPNAVPHLVTAAKTSVGLAVIGAVVGEMFCASSKSGYGLGYWIQATSRTLEADRAFAYFLTSTGLALSIFLIAGAVGTIVLKAMGDRATLHQLELEYDSNARRRRPPRGV